MKGFQKSKTILEYNKITALVAAHCMTEPAKAAFADIEPSDDEAVVNRLLDETEQALGLLVVKGSPGFSAPAGVTDSAGNHYMLCGIIAAERNHRFCNQHPPPQGKKRKTDKIIKN